MGRNDGEPDSKPIHRVAITDFYIGQTEVTQAQWRVVMGNSPSYFNGCDHCPVENVSWNTVQEFIQKINNSNNGIEYRLPTEAEWEYAARGGTKRTGFRYAGSDKIDEVAWWSDNSSGVRRRSKAKKPNELGLYDMSGNVSEWCSDWYDLEYYAKCPSQDPAGPNTGFYRVIRGGSWKHSAHACHVTTRSRLQPKFRDSDLGFRLARSVSN